MSRKKLGYRGAPPAGEILSARRGFCMTQREAGALAMVSQATWAGWETGLRPMHPWIWEQWLRRAPDESVRLRPYVMRPVDTGKPTVDGPFRHPAEEGKTPSEYQRDGLKLLMDKYGIEDERARVFLGISLEQWEYFKQGYIYGSPSVHLKRLEEYGKSFEKPTSNTQAVDSVE